MLPIVKIAGKLAIFTMGAGEGQGRRRAPARYLLSKGWSCMKKSVIKWIERVFNIDLVVAIVCMLVLVTLTFVGALRRYFLRNPIYWLEEVQTWMIIWIIFCGSSYGFRKGAHVMIDVLTDTFPQRMQKAVLWFSYLCSIIVLGFFFYQSLQLTLQFYRTGKLTTVLRMKSWIVYSMAAIGTFWMGLSATYYTLKESFSQDGKAQEETGGGDEHR